MLTRLSTLRQRALVCAVAPAMLAGACAREVAPGHASDTARTAPATATSMARGAATGGGTEPACPMAGLWQRCSVEKRLRDAGLVPLPDSEPAEQPFLHVRGTRYKLGAAELQVFIYPSASARVTDLATVDTTRVAPPDMRIHWRVPPTLIVSNNLAAILLSLNGRQIERVQLALTAGLPNPTH